MIKRVVEEVRDRMPGASTTPSSDTGGGERGGGDMGGGGGTPSPAL